MSNSSGEQRETETPSPKSTEGGAHAASPNDRRDRWVKTAVPPLLILAAGALLIAGLGMAQRLGWISAGAGRSDGQTSVKAETPRYICPMMCTPPQSEPGRCPACAMELVPAKAAGDDGDDDSIQIEPVARRIANIHTVSVKSMPIARTIRAPGEICYDEGSLKTISAYVDGRLDRLYADYTGVVVEKGDHLALLYAPELYSGQVEFLLAGQAKDRSHSTAGNRVVRSDMNLYESARQRLIEAGMSEQQIRELEQEGEASSRVHLCAPIGGTVIEKYAVEGQYVKEGQEICKLADLSTVWLMLELHPEDAAAIRYGQKVEAEVRSMPGRKVHGRVAFMDPNVDPETRTVGVRVVVPNSEGRLRVGEFAKATITVPVGGSADARSKIYDPELAGKWISPRHPHVIEATPGKCGVCGVDLVPAAQFGFTDDPRAASEYLVVPRDAVLMAGNNSVVYVETEPGQFTIRRVVTGPTCGDQIVIVKGLKGGDQVATRGNFLIDSQMQLVGKPSLIDPTKAAPPSEFEFEEMDLPEIEAPTLVSSPASDETTIANPTPEIRKALAAMPPSDRKRAEKQRTCPVANMPLGSMGTPIKVSVNGKAVFICCEGCRSRLLAEPRKYLARLPKEGLQ